MKSRIWVVLAVFCFVVVIRSVTGQIDKPKLHYANPPPRTSQNQPTQISFSVGQQTRPGGSYGQQEQPPPPLPSYYNDPQNNHNMGVNTFTTYANSFGTLIHRSNGDPGFYYQSEPSQNQPTGGVSPQPLPSYGYSGFYTKNNVNYNLHPNANSNLGPKFISRVDPNLQFENLPPQPSQNTWSYNYDPRDFHKTDAEYVDLGPMYTIRDFPNPQNEQPIQPPLNNFDPQYVHEIEVNYKLRPKANKDEGSIHNNKDLSNQQNAQPNRPPHNNLDAQYVHEMEVNYKLRPKANKDEESIQNNRDLSNQQNAQPNRPPHNNLDPQYVHEMEVNYKLRPKANKDEESIQNNRDLSDQRNAWPIQPPPNNFDTQYFHEMDVNYKLRPKANNDEGSIQNNRDLSNQQNAWSIQPHHNNLDPRNVQERDVNYKLQPKANKDEGSIHNNKDLSNQQNTQPNRPSLNNLDPQNVQEMDVNYELRPKVNNDKRSIHNNKGETIKLQIKNKPFEFGYEKQDIGSQLQMNLSFKMSSNVQSGFVFIRSNLRDATPEKTFEIKRPNLSDETDKVANIQWFVTKEHVYVDVELHNKTGVCLYKRISHGKMLDQKLSKSSLKHPNSTNCLHGNICQIEVDLMKECRGAEITENSNDDNTILTVGLSIFATALVIFAIVAFIKRCWVKRDAQDIRVPQLPTCSPFYVNLLFRKECQEVIDDLEQNHYELID